MATIEEIIGRKVRFSCVDEQKLLKEKSRIEESMALFLGLKKEVKSQKNHSDIVLSIGVTIIVISIVSDAIRDVVGTELSQTNPLMKLGLEKLYDKARDKKWAGNKYEKIIAEIDKDTGYLEKLVNNTGAGKSEAGKMIMTMVTVQKHLAENVAGLAGYIQDGQDAKKGLSDTLDSIEKQLRFLSKKIDNTNFYINTGDGERRNIPMMTGRPSDHKLP